jgi:tripartite ATP-independent transporter DctM subunit
MVSDQNSEPRIMSDDTAGVVVKKATLLSEKIINYLSLGVNSIGVTILVMMMLLTVVDVILRYCFNKPISGALEISQFMMAIIVGFALAYTGTKKGHIVIDVVLQKLTPRTQAVINSINYFLSLATFAVITWRSAWYADLLHTRTAASSVLGIPLYPFVYIVAIGSGIYCLVLLYNLYEHLSGIIRGTRWFIRLGLLLLVAVIVALFFTPVFNEDIKGLMSPAATGLIVVSLLVILLFAGMPIGATMAFLAFLGLSYLIGTNASLTSMGSSPYRTAASYDLSVVPLFVLMGAFCFYSGLSKDLFNTAYRWIGHLPGGLAIATIGACTGFAAVCGSSVATVATIGMVALPEMKKFRYDSALASGCIAVGGGLGILIPPSVILVIYGILTEQSIGKLFLAGFLPGLLQAFLYGVTIYIQCRRNPLLGLPGVRSTYKERFASLKGSWAVLALFLLCIGGIYFGILTPTEAAGVGAFGAFLFALARRKVTWKNFRESLLETSETTAMCFAILIGALLLGYYLAMTRLPFALSSAISELNLNPYIVISLIILLYFLLGTIMSSMAMIVLTVPIFFPVVTALGFDPIWFGIIIVTVNEVGAITPPVGINVFVIQGVAKDIPMYTVFRGIVPFLYADVVFTILITVFPQITLLLPNMMQ